MRKRLSWYINLKSNKIIKPSGTVLARRIPERSKNVQDRKFAGVRFVILTMFFLFADVACLKYLKYLLVIK